MPASTTNPRAEALVAQRRIHVATIHAIDAELRRLEELDPPHLRFAAGLLAARRQSGLSQTMLARLADLDASTVGRIERGQHKNIRLGTIQRLAEVLSLDLETTFGVK